MDNDNMNKEYPNQQQRAITCYDSWKQHEGEKMETEKTKQESSSEAIKETNVKRDDQGRKIIAENVHLLFTGTIEGEE